MDSKPEPTADPEPTTKPMAEPKPESIFALEPEPNKRSDQVHELATKSIQVDQVCFVAKHHISVDYDAPTMPPNSSLFGQEGSF